MTELRHEGTEVATLAEPLATDGFELRVMAVELVTITALLAVM